MMHTGMSSLGSDCVGCICKPYHCTLHVAVRVRGELCTDSLSLRALQDLPTAHNGASLSSNDIEKLKEMGRAEVGLVGC